MVFVIITLKEPLLRLMHPYVWQPLINPNVKDWLYKMLSINPNLQRHSSLFHTMVPTCLTPTVIITIKETPYCDLVYPSIICHDGAHMSGNYRILVIITLTSKRLPTVI
jgi:hypothetical protein